jgi:hypothetical protein
MKNLLLILPILLVGCESFQMIDEYGDSISQKMTGEYGCFTVRDNELKNKAYVEECGVRNTLENYTTGFTLGIIDLSAGQMKFEEALMAYLKANNRNCFITRTNEVSMMGNTQGIEIFYNCKSLNS